MTLYLKPYDLDDIFPLCKNPLCLLRLEPTNRFKCKHCNEIFCSEHFRIFGHDCDSKPVEPIIHHNHQSNQMNQTGLPKCNNKNCRTKLHFSNKFECEKCSKLYCLSHRFDFSHECKKSNN